MVFQQPKYFYYNILTNNNQRIVKNKYLLMVTYLGCNKINLPHNIFKLFPLLITPQKSFNMNINLSLFIPDSKKKKKSKYRC